MHFAQISPGMRVHGLVPGVVVQVLAITDLGEMAEITYLLPDGKPAQRLLYAADADQVSPAQGASRPFDAPGEDFRLAAEAQRIRLAGLYDPMLAVATSDIQPLPHQIQAVYRDMLEKRPLRFLLADDPGAGKTIMAGLLIKELIGRDDVKRCLIVAPGGLVEQWQDELFFKFGLDFELFTTAKAEASLSGNVSDKYPLLIARMDQLSRNDELLEMLAASEWDLVTVDEAHRMGAHYYGNRLNKTKRFQLGELLGRITRHFLLMTATPHAGKEDDFQLFLSLLDRDMFEGKYNQRLHALDTKGIMRRRVKEELLTFEGTPLFPEREAATVPFHLSPAEAELYEHVTDYVRNEMNRADRLNDKRKNTVGFALTVLQRRLASSPAAIHQSLVRRVARLERRRLDMVNGVVVEEPDAPDNVLDDEDFNAEQIEGFESQFADSATSAETIAELDVELAVLRDLVELARAVHASGQDVKWNALRDILDDEVLIPTRSGSPRKLIIFTEHRDTLDYLTGRIRALLGREEAVQAIHGGVARAERRAITEEFRTNPELQILLATDAAGEGLNLQVAHLMVNYDLPWNPNRIEQRFGRIHRIGQTETCRLWNLVAADTREGEVYLTLLTKLEEMRKTYQGKVFDVLGETFSDRSLRDLLMEAIRDGDRPEVRERLTKVIDKTVGEGIPELLADRALLADRLTPRDLAELRQQMDDARARRLQPYYIEMAFRDAFARLGGRLAAREKGRYEITNVPQVLRTSRAPGAIPIATRYERVCFELERIEHPNGVPADLLAPGHPLHDAVLRQALERWGGALDRGTVLVSGEATSPQLLVGVEEEIFDGEQETISRRFSYALVDPDGTCHETGPAPHLDFVPLAEGPASETARRFAWPADAEAAARKWLMAHGLPAWLNEVRDTRSAELVRHRSLVKTRLELEMNRLASEATAAEQRMSMGQKVPESAESLGNKASEIEQRLAARLQRFAKQEAMSLKPPRVVSAALVLPLTMAEADLPADAPIRASSTEEVERRAVDAVLAYEHRLGRHPIEQVHNNKGFDILSEVPGDLPIRIEVKGRLLGAEDFYVTASEIILGRNVAPRYRLALVAVHPDGPHLDEVRYLEDPFKEYSLGSAGKGVQEDWRTRWTSGREPW